MVGLVRRRKGKNEDAHRGGNLPFHAVHLEVFPLQLNNKMGTRTGRISIHLLGFFLFFFFNWVFPFRGLKIFTTEIKLNAVLLGPVQRWLLCTSRVHLLLPSPWSLCSITGQLIWGPSLSQGRRTRWISLNLPLLWQKSVPIRLWVPLTWSFLRPTGYILPVPWKAEVSLGKH